MTSGSQKTASGAQLRIYQTRRVTRGVTVSGSLVKTGVTQRPQSSSSSNSRTGKADSRTVQLKKGVKKSAAMENQNQDRDQNPPAAVGVNDQMSVNSNANRNPPVAPQPNIEDWRHLLRTLVGQNLDLPEFSGKDYEDPNVFIRGCVDSFEVNRIEAHSRVRLAARCLKDDAARWWVIYKNMNLSWAKFCELLRNRYASQSLMMKLSAKLYGQQQTDKESTGLFLEQRHLLARRLLPNATEEQIIAVLLEALRGSTKKLLRSSNFDTVEELITRAIQIEQDEAEERNSGRRIAPTLAQPALYAKPKQATPGTGAAANGTPAQANASRLLPRCHFCSERHWNRDCPANPHRQSENSRGATGGAEPTPSRTAAP